MTSYISGWLTFLGLVFTTALYIMNMVNPVQGEKRVEIHCTVGKLMLVMTLVHILSYPFTGFNNFGLWSAIGLIFITIGTGVILSYLPEAGKIRFHARSLHPALIVGIAVPVVYHILVLLGFF